MAQLSEYLGNKTNNYAEYSGLLAALTYALKHGYSALKVFSDSELMVKQINGQYKVNHPVLKELHGKAAKMIRDLEAFEINMCCEKRIVRPIAWRTSRWIAARNVMCRRSAK